MLLWLIALWWFLGTAGVIYIATEHCDFSVNDLPPAMLYGLVGPVIWVVVIDDIINRKKRSTVIVAREGKMRDYLGEIVVFVFALSFALLIGYVAINVK